MDRPFRRRGKAVGTGMSTPATSDLLRIVGSDGVGGLSARSETPTLESIRAGSMADRARLARSSCATRPLYDRQWKIPPTVAPLPDSTGSVAIGTHPVLLKTTSRTPRLSTSVTATNRLTRDRAIGLSSRPHQRRSRMVLASIIASVGRCGRHAHRAAKLDGRAACHEGRPSRGCRRRR